MLTPFGVLRQPHIASSRKPGPGHRAGILDKQVGRRPAVRSRVEVRLHAEMDLRAIKGDETVPAALPLAGTETDPAVVGKGSGQSLTGKTAATRVLTTATYLPRARGAALRRSGASRDGPDREL